MNSDIALSICIATCNRAAFIGETLNSILPQVTGGVEIVIVDGASTDNTTEVVKSYVQKHPFIRYIRLTAKGGVDQDYCLAVEAARGEYCWLFTDDDVLKPGAIRAVMAAMRHGHELIIANGEIKDAALCRVLEARRLRFLNDITYQTSDFERFFVDVSEYLSFIGCVVIKRSLWDEREKARYFGTVFVHVGVIFQKPFYGTITVLAEPLLTIRYGNALWTSKSFEISLFKWPDLLWSFQLFSGAAKRRVCEREPWRSLKTLLMYRARGVFSLDDYRMLVERRLHSRLKRFFISGIARFPGALLNSALVAYFSVIRTFSPKAEMHLVDLKNSRFYSRTV